MLPVDAAVRIIREVLSALDYAHRHGVVHRDIKPENILLHDGSALVADFGIALAVQSAGGSRMTQTGLSLGITQYMSPEQAMGEKNVDARADVYATGAVLYELLTGEPPFTGASVQAIVAKVMTERPVPPSTVRDTVPAGVEAAVLLGYAAGNRQGDTSAPGIRFSIAMPAAVHPLFGGSMSISRDGSHLAFVAESGGVPRIYLRPLREIAARPVAHTERASNQVFSPDGRWIAFISGSRLQRVPLDGGMPSTTTDSSVTNGIAWLSDGDVLFTRANGRRGLSRVPS